MNIKEKIYTALNASTELTALLAKDAQGQCIYHCRSPSAGSYPVIVYTMLRDEPAAIADGKVLERRVTIRISILTRNGDYEQIYQKIWELMLELGFMPVQTSEEIKNDLFVENADFRIVLSV